MSYTVAYTTDAQIGFRRLDILLQEAALDAVDQISERPHTVSRRSAGGSVVYDFICQIGEVRHYVFLTIRIDAAKRNIEVTEIGHFAKPQT